jgi:hypothetical protein
MTESKFPTEIITLPSKGLVYPETSLLAKGEIEMRYMSAKDEDILTNINFIKQGTAIDKLLKSLVVSPIDLDDLITGDKNAILFAARILGYGHDYTFSFKDKSTGKDSEYTVDLTKLDEKPLNESLFTQGKNEFEFTLPKSGNKITFKLLTGKDQKAIEAMSVLYQVENFNPDLQKILVNGYKLANKIIEYFEIVSINEINSFFVRISNADISSFVVTIGKAFIKPSLNSPCSSGSVRYGIE